MKVLMLGWEFPPFITGGLGTACYGLTRALDRRGVQVTFVLPRSAGATSAHLPPDVLRGAAGVPDGPLTPVSADQVMAGGFAHAQFVPIAAGFSSPYQRTAGPTPVGGSLTGKLADEPAAASGPPPKATARALGGASSTAGMRLIEPADSAPAGAEYGSDLVGQVNAYASFCLASMRGAAFDVIHAHDWMTWPAGAALAAATGKPLIAHVHSTEFDRSGDHVNQQIYDIERAGLHSASRIICVSQLTSNLVVRRYGVPPDRTEVVYNGVEIDPVKAGITGIRRRDKIVLYFGRITFQKGPEYFLDAAQRVLEHMPDVKFVVAGSGDMAQWMIERASEMGIGHRVLFTGFLRGDDIARVFQIADLYVMPSVSEPFGIAPLEAMSHDVPVLISRSSGVSEVLTHALKVDFWDVQDMANKIIAVLRHPPLGQTLRTHGRMEVRQLTWDGAAERCEGVYARAMETTPIAS